MPVAMASVSMFPVPEQGGEGGGRGGEKKGKEPVEEEEEEERWRPLRGETGLTVAAPSSGLFFCV